MVTYFAVFSLAVLFSLFSTARVMAWAKRKGWVDRPDSCRKLHSTPIPRIGGIAIYLSILLSLICVYFLPTTVAASFRPQVVEILRLIFLSGMMVLIGFWDDLKGLKPWTKFTAQSLVALAAWFMNFRILSSWSSEGTLVSLGLLSLPLTMLWIVGITNAFNLIDGVDGLSAGAALFAAAAMLIPSFQQGQLLSPILLVALAGSIIGFLRFNFSPASIFLGDSGSFLLGSMLSLLALQYSCKSTTAFAIGVPIVALGLPVLDTGMVVLRRFLNGKPIFLGDRRHIHHILIERGLKPKNAVILLYGVCGLFGLFSLLFLNPSGRTVGSILVVLGILICIGIHQLHCFEFRELAGYLLRGLRYQRRFLIGNVMAGKMIDGFQSATSIPQMLMSLSSFLDEMEFSRAEVRIPGPDDGGCAFNLKNWKARADGPHHILYRWSNTAAERVDVLSTHFRLEFVFRVRCRGILSMQSPEGSNGADIGRLTFYHPMTAHLPVSAVSLLSRQVWKEFDQAVNRISAHSGPVVADQRLDSNPRGARLLQEAPALARMALIWVAPIVSRLTGFSARR